jgi:hypothetical protein
MSRQSRQGKAEYLERRARFGEDLRQKVQAKAARWERSGPPRWIRAKNRLCHRILDGAGR